MASESMTPPPSEANTSMMVARDENAANTTIGSDEGGMLQEDMSIEIDGTGIPMDGGHSPAPADTTIVEEDPEPDKRGVEEIDEVVTDDDNKSSEVSRGSRDASLEGEGDKAGKNPGFLVTHRNCLLILGAVILIVAVVVGVLVSRSKGGTTDALVSVQTDPVSLMPSRPPSSQLSGEPTLGPISLRPTAAPTTDAPSDAPSTSPSSEPTGLPTTSVPTLSPIAIPTSSRPTLNPTLVPSTLVPTSIPTGIDPLMTMLIDITPERTLKDPATSQNAAYRWIKDSDPMGLEADDPGLFRRYAVAVLGMSLGGITSEGGRGRRGLLRGEHEEGGGDDAEKAAVTAGRRNLQQSGWFSVEGECSWPGIICGDVVRENVTVASGVVTEIVLPRLDLKGTIPDEIRVFPYLTKLDLAENGLQGTIPAGLYDCTMLQGLFLEQNNLTGVINNKVSQLKEMTDLYLGNNGLSGTLPGRFTKLRGMRLLNLHHNSFTGEFPLLRLRDLYYLDISYNEFSGPLPTDLDKFATMRIAYLDHNQFSGTIPATYVDIGKERLIELRLDNNQLCGEIPTGWKHAYDYQKYLLALTFHNNKLTEPLDYSMCTLSVLTGKAEMVELGVNCPLCSCTGMTNICSERCYDGYYFNAAQAEAECEAFREAHPPVVDEADDFYW